MRCASLSVREAWDLKIWVPLTMLFLQNKGGESFKMKIPSSTRFIGLGTFQILLSLIFTWGLICLILWEKFGKPSIGDGKHVRVWKYPWILTINWPLTPLDHSILDPIKITVDHLIDKERLCWNILLLNRYFTPTNEVILKIPLSPLSHLDKLIWREKPNGIFSVHSTYHHICSHRTNQVGENSSTPNFNPLLKAIWKMT